MCQFAMSIIGACALCHHLLSKVEILCHGYLKFKKVGILLQPRPHPECSNHEAGQIAVPLIS